MGKVVVYQESLIKMPGHGMWTVADTCTIPATMLRWATEGHSDDAQFILNELDSESIHHIQVLVPPMTE